MANDSNFTTCTPSTPLTFRPCMTKPFYIYLNHDEYNEELHHFPFLANL